ncbi:hypothetical protein RZS08_39145, partial [Arthrospira platensis SPKY1]|nr:hypothetical protein [Arthrospira platensis SPKY1]
MSRTNAQLQEYIRTGDLPPPDFTPPEQISAAERLNELIRARIALRDEEARSSSPRKSEPDEILPLSFADNSQKKYAQMMAEEGDFGVSGWNGAKAAFMDYATTVGNIGMQMFTAVGT